MYRFLASPAWLGRLAAALALASVMSLLGAWQLSRYEQRSEINERIDSAELTTPAALASVVTPPGPGAAVGPPPADSAGWALVTATGRYDPDHQVLVRGRTLAGRVGVEVVTPLILADGAAVLVDRGWMPATGSAAQLPVPPSAPAGEVTLTGWVRPGERTGAVEVGDDALHTRRIGVTAIADRLPYPIYHGYLQLRQQEPPAGDALTPVPPRRENAWLNAGYAAQWWIFAGLVLVGFGWLAHREAHGLAPRGRREDARRPPGDGDRLPYDL